MSPQRPRRHSPADLILAALEDAPGYLTAPASLWASLAAPLGGQGPARWTPDAHREAIEGLVGEGQALRVGDRIVAAAGARPWQVEAAS